MKLKKPEGTPRLVDGAARAADEVLVSLQLHLNTLTPGSEIGVTLTLPGACVSGRMVSAETWAEAVACLAELGSPAGQSSEVGAFLRQLARPWRELRDRWSKDSDGDCGPFETPQFVHLVGAQFLSGGTLVPGSGVPWRGRLDNVSGWSFGVMVSDQ